MYGFSLKEPCAGSCYTFALFWPAETSLFGSHSDTKPYMYVYSLFDGLSIRTTELHCKFVVNSNIPLLTLEHLNSLVR